MKRFILVVCIMVITVFAFNEVVYGSISGNGKNDEKVLNSVSSKLIRFHVIANSDSVEDQNLKLKVKDEVIKFMAPMLKNSNSIEQSREILKKNDSKIKEISARIIKENGYEYKVNTSLSKENFPVKTYGNITLPEGKYEAYRILIGDAKGKNWWCVMFPPLCFVDVTKGEVADKETSAEMKKVLNDDEFNYVDNENNKVEFKFKIVEIFNNLKALIKG